MKRKKYLIFMLVFMLLCNAVWTGPNVRTVHAEGTSLVQDGNFEDNTEMSTPIQTSDTSISNQGTIGDSKWVYYVSNTTRGANFQIIETGEGDATNKALKVFVDESESEVRNGTIKQNFSEKLTAGTYQITIRAKAENVISATGNAAKIRFNLAGKFDSNKDLMASACTEWKEYSLEYTLDGTETGTSLEIQMYYMAPGGNWILDDISIVKISPKDPTITVSPTTLSLEEEKTGELTATLTDEDGVLGETPTYEWTSSDSTVATVNGEGATATVTAIKAAADPVTITVTAKSADASKRISATCNVTVSAKSNTGNEDTSIIADGGFDKDAVMEEPVEAQGKVGNTYVVSSIGNYGWECSPSAVGTTYQIIQEPDNSTANNVLKVLHDSTLTDNAATINGTFRQSYEDRLENGLEVGETYTVSARVKAVNAINSGASASKIRFNLNGNAATNDIEAKDCTGWKEVSFEYTPTAADSKKMLEIQIYYIAADGYWLFDDISIKKVQPKESTIKINPTSLSLEKGNSSELNAMLTVAKKHGIEKEDVGLYPLMQKIEDLANQNAVLRSIITRQGYSWKREDLEAIQAKKYAPSKSLPVSVFDGSLVDADIDKNAVVIIELPNEVPRPLPQRKLIENDGDLERQARFVQSSTKTVMCRQSRTSERIYIFVKTDNTEQTMLNLLQMEKQLRELDLKNRRIYMDRIENDTFDFARSVLSQNGAETLYFTGRSEEEKTKGEAREENKEMTL